MQKTYQNDPNEHILSDKLKKLRNLNIKIDILLEENDKTSNKKLKSLINKAEILIKNMIHNISKDINNKLLLKECSIQYEKFHDVIDIYKSKFLPELQQQEQKQIISKDQRQYQISKIIEETKQVQHMYETVNELMDINQSHINHIEHNIDITKNQMELTKNEIKISSNRKKKTNM